MQRAIVQGFPGADVSVSIVWINMLPLDSEETARVSARIIEDPRVHHFYDPERRAGKAIARSLGRQGKTAWDMYLFYTKDSEWGNCPPTPVDWVHQLQGDSWADLARYHSGEDLIEELHGAMEKLATPGRFDHRPMDMRPLRFIGEPIQVQFDEKPALEKKPGCPDRFVWGEDTYQIVETLSEWHDYTRRGRMARNMRPTHAAVAAGRGSWGVGRDYYRVRTDTGQVFDLYYDRAPKKADDRKGEWFLYREMTEFKVGW